MWGKIVCKEAKGQFIESECLVIQLDFQWGVSDSKSRSEIAVETRQPEITQSAFVTHFKHFLVYRKRRGTSTGRHMKALYSWERDSGAPRDGYFEARKELVWLVVVVLPDSFRGMGACRNFTETQQLGHTPRSRPMVKNGSSAPTSRHLNVVVRSPPLYPRGRPNWRDNYPEGPDHPVAPPLNRLDWYGSSRRSTQDPRMQGEHCYRYLCKTENIANE